MKSDFPPLTEEQRARLADDWSDAAIERWTEQLRTTWGVTVGVKRAQEYRSMYGDGTPGAAFWSRVIARLLCLERPAPTPDEIEERRVAEFHREAIERAAKESRDEVQLRRSRPAARSTAYPSTNTKAVPPKEPGQGSLF